VALATTLFDHLIRPQQERFEDRKAERLRRLEVDQQFEAYRLLHRNLCRLRAFQELVDNPWD
jgi:hypothetical protein